MMMIPSVQPSIIAGWLVNYIVHQIQATPAVLVSLVAVPLRNKHHSKQSGIAWLNCTLLLLHPCMIIYSTYTV